MKKYLIEGKYTEGQHKGKTFVLAKGGYVVNNIYLVFVSDCYDTKKAAQMVATKMTKRNKFDSAYCKNIDPCEYTVKEVEVGGAL